MRPRLTDLRIDILNNFKQALLPMSAKDIHAKQPQTKLSTIYRALEYLESNGDIESITVSCKCGTIRYYHISNPHQHFFHCEICHSFFQIQNFEIKNIENLIAKKNGFIINRHLLYFVGKCKNCQNL